MPRIEKYPGEATLTSAVGRLTAAASVSPLIRTGFGARRDRAERHRVGDRHADDAGLGFDPPHRGLVEADLRLRPARYFVKFGNASAEITRSAR